MTEHRHKVFNSNDYVPKRFGLNYSPPQIIIEYLAPSTGKLYHHKMRLHKFRKDKNNAEIIKELYERHQIYLDKKKVSSEQLIRLIERLKQNFVPRKKKNEGKNEESKVEKNNEKPEVKKEIIKKEKKEEKKEEKSSEIEEDFDFGEVESSMKSEKKENKNQKENEKQKEPEKKLNKKIDKKDDELEEEEEEYGFDEFEDEDLNKLNDSALKKKKAEMDIEFEKNNIKKGDANFQYDIRKEFDHEQYAAEWDEESY
jgi:centrosomal protein CEP19